MAQDDGTFDNEDIENLFANPRLIYRVTESVADEMHQETSLYTFPTVEDKIWLAQVLSVGDHTISNERIGLDTKLLKALLPHLQKIVEGFSA